MQEQELITLLMAYSEKFGEPYMRAGDQQSAEEIAAEVRRCLETGKPRKEDDSIKPDDII